MIDYAIRIENLKKAYKLYNSPTDRLKELLLHRPLHKEFIALDDINLNVQRGETLGIIGENGAGKSTLLKILAKTLYPTSGIVELKGTVSSLLELGSGLHPEFTGIDNIFFYGSLLGISKDIMESKIKSIIDFAEIGDFINYPIKTYSSGMFVRLAFAVATTVDPDILIIDEALSVGDQYFQKKCLDKIAEFKKRGKTIVFCSHDMYQIKTFCEKAIWLHKGKINNYGNADDVVTSYVDNEVAKTDKYKEQSAMLKNRPNETAEINTNFLIIMNLAARQPSMKELTITFDVKSKIPFYGHIGWAILRHDHLQISFDTTKMQGLEPILFANERQITIKITNLNIVKGSYIVYVGIFDKEAYKPIAVESISTEITTGYEILNSICHFSNEFIVA